MTQITAGTLPLNINPNPVHTILHVTMANVQGIASIRIMDLLGKQLYAEKQYVTTSALNKDINISNLSSGMYIVEVSTTKGTNKNRFLKY